MKKRKYCFFRIFCYLLLIMPCLLAVSIYCFSILPSVKLKEALKRHDTEAVRSFLDDGLSPDVLLTVRKSDNLIAVIKNKLTGEGDDDHGAFEIRVSALMFSINEGDTATAKLLLKRG